jgi:hypothetical protein
VTAPPRQLDGADVLRYVVSKREVFHLIEGTDPPARVAAMAICQYEGDNLFYLFKCTSDWDVVGDTDCQSIEEAMQFAAQHVPGETLNWVSA